MLHVKTNFLHCFIYVGFEFALMSCACRDSCVCTVFQSLDEFHYLNDPDRGTVWEESVVNSPHHVLLVALSATMANASDLRDWFSDVHGPTVLVESNHRPVPLKFSFCQREGMIPLLASEGADVLSKSSKSRRRRDKASNGDGKSRKPKMHPSLMTLIAEGLPDKNRDRMQRRRQRPDEKRKGFDEAKKLAVLLEKYDSSSARDKSRPRRRYRDVPSFPFVVRVLRRKDMLPSIVFIFSRNGCDRAAMAAATERSQLVTASEERAIRERIDAFTAEHPGLVSSERIALALQGIASHHAGLLPIWKACVEGLFQDNLIKVVFATETLAAGINMPARTTVISALSKRSGDANIVPLSTSQVLQMAGRAGRRGKDSVGYSVIMRSPYEGPIEAFRVVTADVDVLNSHFTPSYGMVLNLLQTRSLDDARILVERSFGSFLRQKQLAKQEASKEMLLEKRDTRQMEKEEAEKAALQAVLREAQEIVSRVNEKGLSSYITAVERVKAERRALSYVERQSRQINSQLIEDTLPFAPPGTRLRLRGSRVSGESRGVIRRKKRREFAHALAAASDGDGGAEVRAYFLENDWERTYDIEDESDEEGEREILDGVLLDLGPEVGVSVLFAAVCDNGSMCFFSHENVETMYFDEDPVNVDVLVPEWKHVELPPRSSWHGISSNQYFAPVPADLEPLVKAISAWKSTKSQQVLGVETESKTCEAEIDHSPDVLAQREKLAYAKSLVRDHVLHGEAETVLALRARKACRQLEAQLSAYTSLNEQSSPKRSSSRSSGRGRQKQVSGKMLVDDKHEPSIPPADSFSDFMDIVRVSQEYGFIDSEYCVTSLGDVGAKIRAENELWTSLVLLDSALEDASPVHFSAIMGAVLSEGGRQEDYVAYEPSQESLKLARDLEPLRTRLLSVQATYGVDFPVSLEIEHMGLVEAWASGETWVDLLRNTTLQEGDVCRILRRVLDILRQIPHVPFVSDKIKLNARRALTLASRFPVVDDQTYTVRESEKTYQDSSEETYGTSDSAYDPEDNPNSL